MERNIKPSEVDKIYEALEQLKQHGISRSILLDLLNARTKVGKRTLDKILTALVSLEKEVEKNRRIDGT